MSKSIVPLNADERAAMLEVIGKLEVEARGYRGRPVSAVFQAVASEMRALLPAGEGR